MCISKIKTRYAFYNAAVDALEAALRDQAATTSKKTRFQMDVLTPELNPCMDAFRVGTLLEMVHERERGRERMRGGNKCGWGERVSVLVGTYRKWARASK